MNTRRMTSAAMVADPLTTGSYYILTAIAETYQDACDGATRVECSAFRGQKFEACTPGDVHAMSLSRFRFSQCLANEDEARP